eukprot:1160658-Pelagomonas_calceolata.AAC.2
MDGSQHHQGGDAQTKRQRRNRGNRSGRLGARFASAPAQEAQDIPEPPMAQVAPLPIAPRFLNDNRKRQFVPVQTAQPAVSLAEIEARQLQQAEAAAAGSTGTKSRNRGGRGHGQGGRGHGQAQQQQPHALQHPAPMQAPAQPLQPAYQRPFSSQPQSQVPPHQQPQQANVSAPAHQSTSRFADLNISPFTKRCAHGPMLAGYHVVDVLTHRCLLKHGNMA